jgi:prolipoprotein diacylglyceryltransferase
MRSLIASNLVKRHADRILLQHPLLSSYTAMGVFGVVYVALYQFGTRFTTNLLHEKPALYKPLFTYSLLMLNSLVTAIPFIFVMIVLILIRRQELQESSDIPQEPHSFVDAEANPF